MLFELQGRMGCKTEQLSGSIAIGGQAGHMPKRFTYKHRQQKRAGLNKNASGAIFRVVAFQLGSEEVSSILRM